MQRVTLVRYVTKPEFSEQNEAMSRAVFEELRVQQPAHVAYGLFRNGHEFVHVFINSEADDATAITELPSFKHFSDAIDERCEVPPQATRLSTAIVESYGLP